ncbi:MAG: glutathione transferase [Rhodoferax sp.]|nr:glutathione transferase [Rhodoferax sp.]MDP3651456.1 glutathione transferase [Rhodoferax sp.]
MQRNETRLFVDHRFSSPYALSVFVTLREKGIAFAMETLDLQAGQHQQAAYREQSMTARVPTLVHQGFALSESSAISEYLEDQFPAPAYAPVYPTDVRDRARARQIQAWLRSDLMPIRNERSTAVVFIEPTATPLSAEGLEAADKLFRIADSLLADGASHLFGAWCIADTDLALMLNRLALNGDAVPPKLKAYASQQWQRPTVQQWVQQART